jgi:hypothetical protein
MKDNIPYQNLRNEVDGFYKKSEETLERMLFRLKKHHNAMSVSKNVDEQQKILLNTLELLQQGIDMDLVNVVKVVVELEKQGVTESLVDVQKTPEVVIN